MARKIETHSYFDNQPPDDTYARQVYRTRRWQRLRLHKLRLNPLCEVCTDTVPAEHVHHLTDIADAPELAFVLANLQSLCAFHHGQITRERQRRP